MNEQRRDDYSIDFHNGFREPVSVCVAAAAPHAQALAWRTAEVLPGGQKAFSWTVDYSFFYSITSALRPGSVVVPTFIVPVEKSGARVRFHRSGSSFALSPVGSAPPNVLVIDQDASIPAEGVTIGLAIDGLAAVAVRAQPSIETQFVLHPVYWLALARSPIEPGSVTDPSSFFAIANIEFRGESRHVATALTAAGTLIVAP